MKNDKCSCSGIPIPIFIFIIICFFIALTSTEDKTQMKAPAIRTDKEEGIEPFRLGGWEPQVSGDAPRYIQWNDRSYFRDAPAQKRIRVIFYFALGKNSLNSNQARALVAQVQQYFLIDHNIRIIASFIQGRDAYPHAVDISKAARLDYLYAWGDKLTRLNRDKAIPKVAITKPLEYLGGFYLAGYASSVGAYRRSNPFAFCTGEVYNDYGAGHAYRIPHSNIACYHELSHLLGAAHDNAVYANGWRSYMNENALPYVPNIFASGRNKSEILRCVNR